MSKVEKPPRHACEGCVLGKMHMYAFPKDGLVRVVRKLQLVHSDVCGPMCTPSLGNILYFVTLIDDYQGFLGFATQAKIRCFHVFSTFHCYC